MKEPVDGREYGLINGRNKYKTISVIECRERDE